MKRNKYLLRTLAVCTMITGGCWSVQAQGVALDWAKQLSTTTAANSNGNAVALDADGNIYTCGRFSGTTDFDPGPATLNLTAVGATDMYIMKQNPAGQLLWARGAGGTSPSANLNQAVSIAVDGSGNVYTGGIYAGNVDFDPGPGTAMLTFAGGWNDAFICKHDPAGNLLWAKSYSGPQDESIADIRLDDAGNIYVFGAFNGTVDFNPGAGVFNMTSANGAGFLTKLDTAGNFVWAKQFSGAGNFLPASMALSPAGNIYLVGGITDAAVDLDPGTAVSNMQPQGFADACVIKLDNNGNFGWARQIGGTFTIAVGLKVTVDKLERIYAAGIYLGAIDFSTAPTMSLSSTADEDIFLARLDASGNFQWTKTTVGAPGTVAELYGLKADPHNNILLSGFFRGAIDFDPGTGVTTLSTTNATTTNGFFLKLDNSGNLKWANKVASNGFSSCRAITADLSGNVYTTGHFKDTADFEPGTAVVNMYAPGKENIFVARYMCTDTTSSVVVEPNGKCSGYDFLGVHYDHSGTFTVSLPNAAGCDSIITLNLTLNTFQAGITANQFLLQAAAPYTTYQWLKGGVAIAGATNNTYQVTSNGAYSLRATNTDGCIDTSDVYTVSDYTGINDANVIAAQISVYPNPASDVLFIKAPLSVNLVMTDIAGKVLLHADNAKSLSVAQLAPGIYMLRITDKDGNTLKTEKIVRNR